MYHEDSAPRKGHHRLRGHALRKHLREPLDGPMLAAKFLLGAKVTRNIALLWAMQAINVQQTYSIPAVTWQLLPSLA